MPDILALALDIGFERAGEFDAGRLEFREDVRLMCAADRCGRYNKSWSCPPACGSLAALEAGTRRYGRGVLVQTVGALDGDFDAEGIAAALALHRRRFDALARQARLVTGGDCFPMGAGSCARCVKCTYPSRPCRRPEGLWPSMEACGLLVADVCALAGLEYNAGSGAISYVSCVLYRAKNNNLGV